MKDKLVGTIFTIFFITSLAAEPSNLIYNGNFEEVATRDNLWDGVDGNGRLKVFNYSAPQMADLTGDGLEDLIVGDEHGWLMFYKNSGAREEPKFTSGEPLLFYVGLFAKPCLVDWDNDGRIDILIGDMGGHVYFVENTGRVNSPRFYRGPGIADVKTIQYGGVNLDLGAYIAPAVADISGDGKRDLLLGEGTYSANSVYLYLNSGSDSAQKFDEGSRYYLAYGDGREHLVPFVVDWNRDGVHDLIAGENLGYINLYLGTKPDTSKAKSIFDKPSIEPMVFTERIKHEGGDYWGERVSPCMIDWEKDGDLDIIFGDRSGLVYLSKNTGSDKNYKFAKPIPITGQDTMFDEKFPVGWSTSFSYHRYKPNGGRWYGGAFLPRIASDPYAGQYAFEVKNLFGYHGPLIGDGSTPHLSEFCITGRITKPLKVEGKYRLTFYAKGDDIRVRWIIWYHRRTVTAGVRGYEYFEVSEEFTSSSKWGKIEKSFKFPGREKGETFDCPFRIHLTGRGNLSIDDVSLVEE